MDEFNKIRKAFFQEDLTINQIACRFKRSCDTVNAIVNTSRDIWGLGTVCRLVKRAIQSLYLCNQAEKLLKIASSLVKKQS